MIKKDAIIQVIIDYNFDLYRGDKNIVEYMREHCKCYYDDICKAIQGDNMFWGAEFIELLNDKLSELKRECKEIPEILELNYEGKTWEMYEKGYRLFDNMKSSFLCSGLWTERDKTFYRIRKGDFRIENENDRKEKKNKSFISTDPYGIV